MNKTDNNKDRNNNFVNYSKGNNNSCKTIAIIIIHNTRSNIQQ